MAREAEGLTQAQLAAAPRRHASRRSPASRRPAITVALATPAPRAGRPWAARSSSARAADAVERRRDRRSSECAARHARRSDIERFDRATMRDFASTPAGRELPDRPRCCARSTRVDFVVVGGVAAVARGSPQLTQRPRHRLRERRCEPHSALAPRACGSSTPGARRPTCLRPRARARCGRARCCALSTDEGDLDVRHLGPAARRGYARCAGHAIEAALGSTTVRDRRGSRT